MIKTCFASIGFREVEVVLLADHTEEIVRMKAVIDAKDNVITSINTLNQHLYDVQNDLENQIARLRESLAQIKACFDTSQPSLKQTETAKKMKADYTINSHEVDFLETVKKNAALKKDILSGVLKNHDGCQIYHEEEYTKLEAENERLKADLVYWKELASERVACNMEDLLKAEAGVDRVAKMLRYREALVDILNMYHGEGVHPEGKIARNALKEA